MSLSTSGYMAETRSSFIHSVHSFIHSLCLPFFFFFFKGPGSREESNWLGVLESPKGIKSPGVQGKGQGLPGGSRIGVGF